MNWFNIFSKGPMKPKQIDKAVALIENRFAQTDVRLREMAKLLEEGTPEAWRAVLKRFAMTANGQIADEQEKHWLEDELVHLGSNVSIELEHYVRTETHVTYPLRAFERISGADAGLELSISALEGHGADCHRSIDAKLELVWHIAENLSDTFVIARLLPFLLDFSDDVRWAVMDIIEALRQKETEFGEEFLAELATTLGKLVTDDEASTRIASRAAELLHAFELPNASQSAAQLRGDVDPAFFFDKKGYLRRRKV